MTARAVSSHHQNERLEQSQDADGGKRRGALAPRALVIGLLCAALLCAVTPYTDVFLMGSELVGCHFPLGAMCLLFIIALVARFIGRLRNGPSPLSPQDLAFVFCIMLVAAGLPTWGLMCYMLPAMTCWSYYATPENRWEAIYHKYLPDWFVPKDASVITQFYEGGAAGGRVPWDAWVGPLIVWLAFALVLYAVMLCVATMVRKQWIEREHLTFPIVELPVGIITGRERASGSPLLRNWALWIGAGIPGLVHSLNSLHVYWPHLPQWQIHQQTFPQNPLPRPWQYFRLRWSIFFSVIGFGYFLTTDVSFGLWFFYIFDRIQCTVAEALGVYPQYKRVTEAQYIGAFLAVVGIGVWVARGQLRAMMSAVLGRSDSADDRDDPLPWRVAMMGLVVCCVLFVVLATTAGVRLPIALFVYVWFLIICWGMARIVSETGLLFAKATQMMPTKTLDPLLGTRRLTGPDVAITYSLQYVHMYDLKSFLMPAITHSLKIGHETNLVTRHLTGAMVAGILLGIGVSLYSTMRLIYAKGALALSPWFFQRGPSWHFGVIATLLSNRTPTDFGRLGALAAGAAFTLMLALMRHRFLWWPFHPIGYVLAYSSETRRAWFPFFVGWLCKVLITRYGSGRAYQRLRPLFLGLVLGEYLVCAFWLIIAAATGTFGHKIFP